MGPFERYLTVWVGLGIVAGVGLGLWVPGLFQAVAALEFAHVKLMLAVFMLAGMLTRHLWLKAGGTQRLARGVASLKPWSVVGLIATVVLGRTTSPRRPA